MSELPSLDLLTIGRTYVVHSDGELFKIRKQSSGLEVRRQIKGTLKGMGRAIRKLLRYLARKKKKKPIYRGHVIKGKMKIRMRSARWYHI